MTSVENGRPSVPLGPDEKYRTSRNLPRVGVKPFPYERVETLAADRTAIRGSDRDPRRLHQKANARLMPSGEPITESLKPPVRRHSIISFAFRVRALRTCVVRETQSSAVGRKRTNVNRRV